MLYNFVTPILHKNAKGEIVACPYGYKMLFRGNGYLVPTEDLESAKSKIMANRLVVSAATSVSFLVTLLTVAIQYSKKAPDILPSWLFYVYAISILSIILSSVKLIIHFASYPRTSIVGLTPIGDFDT